MVVEGCRDTIHCHGVCVDYVWLPHVHRLHRLLSLTHFAHHVLLYAVPHRNLRLLLDMAWGRHIHGGSALQGKQRSKRALQIRQKYHHIPRPDVLLPVCNIDSCPYLYHLQDGLQVWAKKPEEMRCVNESFYSLIELYNILDRLSFFVSLNLVFEIIIR